MNNTFTGLPVDLRNYRTDRTIRCSDEGYAYVVGSGDEVLPEPLDRARWEDVKDRYYQLRGWNVDTGRPTRPKLEQLGLGDVADVLETAGRLGE